jgi:hypothetical protein
MEFGKIISLWKGEVKKQEFKYSMQGFILVFINIKTKYHEITRLYYNTRAKL